MQSLMNAGEMRLQITKLILMNRIIKILLLVVFVSACNNDSGNKEEKTDNAATVNESTGKDTSKVTDGHHARSSLDWAGTYKGVVPCADCEGIETEIMLHSDNTYMLSAKYLGKKDAAEYKSEGKWKWLDGSNIELEGIENGPSKYFVAENKIIQLDMEGKKIGGNLAEKYALKK